MLFHVIDNIVDLDGSNNEYKLIHLLCRYSTVAAVKHLVSRSPTILESVSITGCKPVHFAFYNNRAPVIKYLLEEKRVSVDDRLDNHSLISWALLHNMNRTACTILIDELFLRMIPEINTWNQLHDIFKSDKAWAMSYLIGKAAFYRCSSMLNCIDPDTGRSPVHYVCNRGYYNILADLVASGTSLEGKDSYGIRPIHFACGFRYSDVRTALYDAEQRTMITYLHAKGVDMNAEMVNGQRPIDIMCHLGSFNMIMYLINLGVNLRQGKNQLVSLSEYLYNNQRIYACDRKHIRKILKPKIRMERLSSFFRWKRE